jgi:preprotein translocase subunit SecB
MYEHRLMQAAQGAATESSSADESKIILPH